MPTPKFLGGHFFIMPLNLEKINADVQAWAGQATQSMVSKASGMDIHHRANSPSPRPSLQLIVARFKYAQGLVHIVSFRMPRTLIYTHKGAGKGIGGNSGSSWADRKGEQHKTNPKSMGKLGSSSRKEKPFFNQAMTDPTGMQELGDIIVTSLGDGFINDLLIK